MSLSRSLLCLLTLLSACQSAPRRGATVLFASGADLQGMNSLYVVHPLAKQVQKYALLTTLVRYDSALTPQPYLARSWSWSADRRHLTFTLSDALTWHDGRPTTAADVAWTIQTAMLPETGYPRLTDLAELDSVLAVDDTTVRLGFATPQPNVPDVLTDLAILPLHLLDTVPPGAMRSAQWNRRPVGNGPFRFVSHEANRRWVFQANPDFPEELGGPPRLERFIVVVVDEPTTKLAALTSGELDFAGISPAHADFVQRDPRLEVLSYPLLFSYAMVFNTRLDALADFTVRQAASLALDRRQIVDGYIFGFGHPAAGPIPAELPVPIARGDPPQPNPDSARALLAGRPVAIELLTVGSGEAPLEQMIQSQLSRAGFDVSIRQLELSAFLDRVYGPRPEFEVAVMGVPGDVGLGHLGPLVELAGMASGPDPLANAELLTDSLAAVFIYHARGVQGRNRRIQGVTMDLRGELATLSDWHVASPNDGPGR